MEGSPGCFSSSTNHLSPKIIKPPPFKGLNVRIPVIVPIKEGWFINRGSTLKH